MLDLASASGLESRCSSATILRLSVHASSCEPEIVHEWESDFLTANSAHPMASETDIRLIAGVELVNLRSELLANHDVHQF